MDELHALRIPENSFEYDKWRFYMAQDFYPIDKWPLQIINIALKTHKNNLDRLNFIKFLQNNGLSNMMIWQFINYRDRFDANGRKQITYLIQQPYTKGFYYDMITRRYEPIPPRYGTRNTTTVFDPYLDMYF